MALAWIINDTTALEFDATVRESHTSEATVTENPIESGVSVADHAYMNPLRLDIEGAVSDLPLNTAITDDLFGSASAAGELTRSAQALKVLQDLQSSFTVFSIQTGLRLYQNMILVSLAADQDASTARILVFRASLREVIRVSTRTVTYPPRAPGKTTRQASKPVKAGEVQGKAPEDTPTRKSILSEMLGVDTTEGQAIGDANPDASPELHRLLGPG